MFNSEFVAESVVVLLPSVTTRGGHRGSIEMFVFLLLAGQYGPYSRQAELSAQYHSFPAHKVPDFNAESIFFVEYYFKYQEAVYARRLLPLLNDQYPVRFEKR